jgi:hypothetical protein
MTWQSIYRYLNKKNPLKKPASTSERLEYFNHGAGGRGCARRVLTGDEAAIDNVEVIPDTRSPLV